MPDREITYPIGKNLNDRSCRFCDSLNHICQSSSFEVVTHLSGCFGEGDCTRIMINPSVEILTANMAFSQDMVLESGENANSSLYDLLFLLEGGILWQEPGRKTCFDVERDDSGFFHSEEMCRIGKYSEGQHFSFINVRMTHDFCSTILEQMDIERLPITSSCHRNHFRKGETSFSVKRILHDIINCTLPENTKRVYLKAKVMELLAVYMGEIVYGETGLMLSPNFSGEDIDGLHRAKTILDADIAHAPTISSLARQTYLSERKLKTGFKGLFGTTVHAYVIDRRLDNARFLLESGAMSVTEAARSVGYNELGRFAERFRKKFGLNPSEYVKQRGR